MDKRTTSNSNKVTTTKTVQRQGSRTSAQAGAKTSGQAVTRTITKTESFYSIDANGKKTLIKTNT